MRPLIINCGSGVNLRFMLKWLKEGGYGAETPAFGDYDKTFPDHLHVFVTRDGARVNSTETLAQARHYCEVIDGGKSPTVYSDIGRFLTSHRNVSMDGTSRVYTFLPPPTV